jgi:hypothetical protein
MSNPSGTIVICFLPYTKKPSLTEPNSKPQISDDVLNATSLDAAVRWNKGLALAAVVLRTPLR